MSRTMTAAQSAQANDARLKANRVRMARAAVLRALENEDVTLAEVLANPVVATATVFDVVSRVRYWWPGRRRAQVGQGVRRQSKRAGIVLDAVGIDKDRLVLSLSYRECAALLAENDRERAALLADRERRAATS